MIKIGDYVKPKDKLTERELGFLKAFSFPMLITKIFECDDRDEDDSICNECPGCINESNGCFGYESTFVLTKVPKDWDS